MNHEDLDGQIQMLAAYAEEGVSGKRSWNDVWDLIKQVGSSFKGTHYPTRDAKDCAWERFQRLVTQVKEAQAGQRAEAEKQACALNERIEQFESQIPQAKCGSTPWADVWATIKEVGALFKGTRYPKRDDKERAWERFQRLVAQVKEAQASQRAEAERQARALNERIDQLDSQILYAKNGCTPWGDVWTTIKEVGGLFKGSTFPSPHERESAWSKYQGLVTDVKKQQEEVSRERARCSQESESCKDRILNVAGLACSTEPIDTMLAVAGAVAFGPLSDLGSFEDQKQNLLFRSGKLKEAWDLFATYKDKMLGTDKREVFQYLRNIQESLDAEWAAWKEAQHRAYNERGQTNIQKLEDRLGKLYDILSKREEHLGKLEGDRDGAWSDGFRERVEGWISEEEARIADIKEQIRQVEGWLEEARGRLR